MAYRNTLAFFFTLLHKYTKKRLTLSRYLNRLFQLLLALILVSTTVQAQRVYIYGKIYDENGLPVELATVNEEKGLKGTISNLKGEYNLTVNYSDTITMVFRMVGHEIRKRDIYNAQDTVKLDVMLPTNGYAIQGVTISESRRQSDGMQTIEAQGIRLTPGANGGSVESIISTQAGVSSQNELSNQYNVRGGNFDENSVYVNGIEILRPILVRAGEQEGLSFINPDMIESIGFSTGGFDATYGDKMSSVLEITYRKPKGFETTISGSLLGGSAFIGAGNEKISFSGSIRYKTNKYLLNTLDTDGEYDPSFFDYQTYITWSPSERWEIEFLGNIARNQYNFTPSTRNTSFGTAENIKTFTMYFDGWEKDSYNTLFGSLNLKHNFNENNSISLNASLFNSNEEETFDIRSEYWLDDAGSEQLFSVGGFMEHARNYLISNVISASVKGSHRNLKHHLRWGTEVKHEFVEDKMREWELTDSAGYNVPHYPNGPLEMRYSLTSGNTIKSIRAATYLQETYRQSLNYGFLTINAGIRASYWNWNKELIVSPRVSVGFIPGFNDNLTFRLSSGIYYQSPFYKELKDTIKINGIHTVQLNKKIKSQRSIQVVAGADYHFRVFDRPFKFTAEAYYKKLDNLIPYNLDNVRIIYYGENCAKGYAAGLDLKLFGEFVPGTDSWITFSLMKTEEKIDSRWIPRPTDQLYNLSLHFTDYFPGTDRWKMTLRGVMSDGLPFGPSHTGREEAVFRAPAYKRIDIGMAYDILNDKYRYRKLSNVFNSIWLSIDCLNLLDINNVCSYYWVTDTNNTQYGVPNYLTGRQFNISLLMQIGK